MSKTTGEIRVRTEFNVSKNSKVDVIKQKTAELINLVNDLPLPDGYPHQVGEFVRLKAVAMTEFESAAHWAVKAATA